MFGTRPCKNKKASKERIHRTINVESAYCRSEPKRWNYVNSMWKTLKTAYQRYLTIFLKLHFAWLASDWKLSCCSAQTGKLIIAITSNSAIKSTSSSFQFTLLKYRSNRIQSRLVTEKRWKQLPQGLLSSNNGKHARARWFSYSTD